MSTVSHRTTVRQSGFTIIEVLIVLGIAGLIIMLTFLAIPALQRSNRNSERKQSVASLLQDASHFELSNSGIPPNACGPDGGALPKCTDSGQFADIQGNGYYDDQYGTAIIFCSGQNNGSAVTYPGSSTQCVTPDASGNIISSSTDTETVVLYNYARCSTTTNGQATIQGADSRNIVALFTLENSGSGVAQCQQLGS